MAKLSGADRDRIAEMERVGQNARVANVPWIEDVLRPLLPQGQIILSVVEWFPVAGLPGSTYQVQILNRDHVFWFQDDGLIADRERSLRSRFEEYLHGE